ncbi:glucuronide transporter [Streptomyces sp. LHD-70]|uniref:glucuronide transporter n=1 Tax=Streptomyces sp. LHD-70 TaxID=3072140 RepID=UPI00280CA741|nr:glucuronide transporter [Streptomyces sp. LHD-70]MDQ8702556.1 glucuronide transporter [Streptomyces sp. LHD-70]
MKLRASTVLGYGAGDAANNLAFSLSGMFLLLYYTDVVGLSAAAVGTLILLVRVWDAFADIFAGRMVDRMSSRWGKFRPFILFGAVPLLLLNVAVFNVPDMSQGAQLVYAYVTYALLGLAYSLVNIPYGSLATAMTQEPSERAKLAAIRGVGAQAVIIVLVIAISPALKSSGSGLQSLFTNITWIFVGAGALLYLCTFLTARERVERSVVQVSFRQTVAALKGNRPLYVLCANTVVVLSGLFALQAAGAFYARDVLGDPRLYIVLFLVSAVMNFAIAPLMPRIVKSFGKRNAYIAAGGLTVVGGVGTFLLPATPVALPIVAWTLHSTGLAIVSALLWALEADTVEYGEWKSGVRTEGATYAVFSFTRKISQAIGAAVASYALAIGGYEAGAAHLTDGALTGIRFAAGAVPAITALIAIAIMWRYPLTDSRFQEIVREMAERREKESRDAAPAVAPMSSTA